MRKKVAVLMGGSTPEYEISVLSGMEVYHNIDRSKFESLAIVISKDNREWYEIPQDAYLKLPNPLFETVKFEENIKKVHRCAEPFSFLMAIDVVFIAMHGSYGEDGSIQGMLEVLGIKYTGSGVLASALGMDKLRFRLVMQACGIKIPQYIALTKEEDTGKIGKLGVEKYFVKPNNQGSSVGTTFVKKKEELAGAIRVARKYSETVLVDEYLEGREVTCAVLGNDKKEALPLVEIVPRQGEYFDYKSKYISGGADEIIPARFSDKMSKFIQSTAIEVCRVVGTRGFARVDFIVKDDKAWVLEVNTIPGLTPMSLFPKAAAARGITYKKLIEMILSYV